jgi:glutathione S-transferase
VLYELAGAGETRFSPNCWRSIYALHHKGLPFERSPILFGEKDRIAFSGQKLVPVLQDSGTVISDSLTIAEYLEKTYPDGPTLFGGNVGRAQARFINAWADKVQISAFRPLIVRDAYDHVDPTDQAYYRENRESRYGGTLEDMQTDRGTRVHEMRRLLEPVRTAVSRQGFLAGDAPAYADYTVFGSFMWAKSVSTFSLLESDDPVYAWRGRMLELFDGLGHETGYPVA